MTPMAHLQQGSSEASERFKALLKEWVKDHHMFASTLQDLTGQLALLQPPPQKQEHTDGSKAAAERTVLQRVAERAPSERLAAYAAGKLITGTLQRGLPEQLDQNLRLLGVLAAEMRRFVGQMEAVADASAAQAMAAIGLSEAGSGGNSTAALEGRDGGSGAVLVMAAVLEGVARETALIERAAEGITLTSPPEEVSAAATVIQLQPFVDDTLLAAAVEEGEADEEQQRGSG